MKMYQIQKLNKLELGSKAPKSEIGSVSIEHGVIGGCRYKITDISL
ncbi:hypothetical protein wTkk_000504 [Wolbachia endosymbiont of Trichogramma kaykai]